MTERRAVLVELVSRLPGRASLGTGAEDRDEGLATGLAALDALTAFDGLPRGRLSELVGPASSGKLSVLSSTLRRVLAPSEGEPGLAALVDLSGTVFPRGAWASGRLLVVRPRDLPDALRAADVLVSSASFEVVALELSGRLPPRGLPEAVSVRLARIARENGTSLIACAERPIFGALAALRLQLGGSCDGTLHALLVKGRSGSPGAASFPRPGLPWAILAALKKRDAQVAAAPSRLLPSLSSERAS